MILYAKLEDSSSDLPSSLQSRIISSYGFFGLWGCTTLTNTFQSIYSMTSQSILKHFFPVCISKVFLVLPLITVADKAWFGKTGDCLIVFITEAKTKRFNTKWACGEKGCQRHSKSTWTDTFDILTEFLG